MSTPMRIPEGKIVLTYEDYVLLPNDQNRYEILEGELTVTLSPSTKHQTASGNLFILLSQYIKERNLRQALPRSHRSHLRVYLGAAT